MATVKLSALTAIAAAAITATDIVPMTDADAGTPTTYKASMANLRSALLAASGAGWTAADYLGLGSAPTASGMIRVGQGALAGASTPLINSTVTWNNAATTFTHILVTVTDTASNAASLLMDLQAGAAPASVWKVTKAGAVTQASSLTVTAGGLTVSAGTTAVQALTATTVTATSTIFAGAASSVGLTGRSKIASSADGLLTLLNNAGTDFTRLLFGGTTNSFPAITKNSTQLEAKLADDSAFTTFRASAVLAGTGTLAAAGALRLANATTLSWRNAGNTLDHTLQVDAANTFVFSNNIGVTGTGQFTSTGQFGGTLTVTSGGIAVTGASTITGTLGGITTLTATTVAGTLSTAAQPSVTSVGTLTSLTVSGTVTLTAAASKIVPGVTSMSLRNNADSADNLLVTDAGAVTTRSTLTVTAGGFTVTAGTSAVQALTATTGVFTSTLDSGTHTITSTSASALAVGRQGATDPVLKVDASAATVVTGIKITGAAAAAGVAVAAISSGVNENLTIDAKGSGTITLNSTATGTVTCTPLFAMSAGGTVTGANFTITRAAAFALTVGRQGATNPAFAVDSSTGASATGLKVKAAAAAGGLALSVTSSGADENLTIDALGAGTITLGSVSTGAITLTRAVTASSTLQTASTLTVNAGGLVVTAGGLTVSAGTTAVQALTATTGSLSSTLAVAGAGAPSGARVINLPNTKYIAWSDGYGIGSDGTDLIVTSVGGSRMLWQDGGAATQIIVDPSQKRLLVGTTTATNMSSTGDARLAGSLWIGDGVAAPTAQPGFAVLYVDTADGDLKIKFGDGVTKTIVVDT